LQLAVAHEGEAVGERKQRGAQPEKKSGRQGGSSAKWRGKGPPLPSPWIYRSKGATLPEPRTVRINCSQQRPSPTSGPHHAETARRARMRDHYGAATEGSRRPVTSAPTTPTPRASAPPEKARPRRTTAAMTVGIKNGLVPYHVSETLERPELKALKNLTLEGCAYEPVVPSPALQEWGATGTLESGGLLINSSRAS
jgi:hypothetical protein